MAHQLKDIIMLQQTTIQSQPLTENVKNEEEKTSKNKNILTKMNDKKLPNWSLYLTLGTILILVIVACLFINNIID